MESFSSTELLQNAIGTTISGSAQLINAGRDVVLSLIESSSSTAFLPGLLQINNSGRDTILHGSPGLLAAGLKDLFRPASIATHTHSSHVARCDPGTRLEVIAQIEQWLNGSEKRTAICWLSGPAGYGKSAVAQTIAERYAAKGRLLGSFFFLRGAGECSHISRLIPTLAHQISLSVPAVKPLLEKALRDEPALLGPSVSLAYRFQKLIIEPIHSTTSTISQVLSSFKVWSHFAKQKIIVIDALDECDDKAEMAAFIDVLFNAFPGRSHLPFRVLLTSRVEEHILKKIDHPEAQFLNHLDLENFDACSDIQVYFKREFSHIFNQNCQVMQGIPKPWPSARDLTTLLDKAGSSFASAVTFIQLVGGDPMPHKALQRILESGPNDVILTDHYEM